MSAHCVQGTEGQFGWGKGGLQELMIGDELGEEETWDLVRVSSNGKLLQCYKQGCNIIRYVI